MQPVEEVIVGIILVGGFAAGFAVGWFTRAKRWFRNSIAISLSAAFLMVVALTVRAQGAEVNGVSVALGLLCFIPTYALVFWLPVVLGGSAARLFRKPAKDRLRILCENCGEFFDGDVCPVCGTERSRPWQPPA